MRSSHKGSRDIEHRGSVHDDVGLELLKTVARQRGESGFSKERRLEPQITIGLLTAGGFALMVNALEGNKAETTTMLPTITAFMAAHRLRDVSSSPTPG